MNKEDTRLPRTHKQESDQHLPPSLPTSESKRKPQPNPKLRAKLNTSHEALRRRSDGRLHSHEKFQEKHSLPDTLTYFVTTAAREDLGEDAKCSRTRRPMGATLEKKEEDPQGQPQQEQRKKAPTASKRTFHTSSNSALAFESQPLQVPLP